MANGKPFVKICGIKDAEMAQSATSSGANAIGLVFYAPSPRAVGLKAACDIAASLPASVASVALLVNASATEIANIIRVVKPDILQFHGDEDAGFCEQFSYPYWKAIRVNKTTDLLNLAHQFANAERLLLDADKNGLYGGSGEAFDYDLIPQSLSASIILSGGLNPSNVHAAIQAVKPWGVDVSSGVEISKGVKSATLMTQFMKEVSRADV